MTATDFLDSTTRDQPKGNTYAKTGISMHKIVCGRTCVSVCVCLCVCRFVHHVMYLLEEHYQEVVDDKVGHCTEMV